MADQVPLLLRAMEEPDKPHVYATWLQSFRRSTTARTMSNTIYFAGQHKLITELMAHPGVSFLVACSSNHPDQIVGWAAGSLMDGVLVLHYVLVKQTFRRLGVAARLVEKMGQLATVEGLVLCTHLSRDGWAIVKARPGWYHNPYLLYALHGGRKVDG